MQATDPNFTSAQSLSQTTNQQAQRGTQLEQEAARIRVRKKLQRPPRTLAALMFRLSRPNAALAIMMPALCGAILAWWQLGSLHPLTLLFQLASVLTMTLGMQVLNEYGDYLHAHKAANVGEITPQRDLQGLPQVALPVEPPTTGYGLLAYKLLTPAAALSIGYWTLLVSILCSLWLTLLAGWPVLFFSGLSFVLAYTYANTPVRYGYRGWGFGELGIFLGYGLLPLVESYYTQSQTLSWLPILVSLPLGLLSTLVFFNYNLVHEHRDWLMHKRTLVVNLSSGRALDVSAAMTVLVYIAVLCIVSLAHLPLNTLVTLVALPTAVGVFAHVRRAHLPFEDRWRLYSTTTNAALWTGLLFSIALITDKLF